MQYRKLNELKKLPNNPRIIRDKQFKTLCDSIRDNPKYFEARPVILSNRTGEMVIIAGNQRYEAAKSLKLKEVPTFLIEGLDEAKEREIIIRDNISNGEFDMSALANEWSDLPLVEWGVDLPEDWLVEEKTDPADAEPQIDRAAELNKIWRVKPGDLWQIGSHRLLCGDSTKKEDVGRVMGGEKPLLMVTDPPYGIEYDPEWRNEAAARGLIGQKKSTRACGKVTNDDNADWTTAYELCGCDVVYIWHAGIKSNVVQDSIIRAGYDVRTQIIWAKNTFAISRGHYHHQHEPCWYAIRKGGTGHWVGDRSQTTLWEIDKPQKSETGHSTQKPLECMARPIRNHESEFVYDPFLGSGTTMIACQNLNRKCRGIEISPDYCAVILQRMTDAFPNIEIKRLS
jgi:DNA modification methylase